MLTVIDSALSAVISHVIFCNHGRNLLHVHLSDERDSNKTISFKLV